MSLEQLRADLHAAAKSSQSVAVMLELWVKRLANGETSATGLGNYSQRDPIWRNEIFAGGLRFETDGCYVCCVADIVAMAGYKDKTPPAVARSLRVAECFNGANLSYPGRIPDVFPKLYYDGTRQWHHGPAQMAQVWAELENGPVIAEVDFVWQSQTQNQHFVVLVEPTPDRADIWIHDPWDGSRVRLMQKYAAKHWDLGRTIYGLRLLRVEG